MHTSQWIFALIVSAVAISVGGWLMALNASGLGLLMAGLLVLVSNGYAYLKPRLSNRGNPANVGAAASAVS